MWHLRVYNKHEVSESVGTSLKIHISVLNNQLEYLKLGQPAGDA